MASQNKMVHSIWGTLIYLLYCELWKRKFHRYWRLMPSSFLVRILVKVTRLKKSKSCSLTSMLQVRISGKDSIAVYRCVEFLWENDLRGSIWGWASYHFTLFLMLRHDRQGWTSDRENLPWSRSQFCGEKNKICSLNFTVDDYINGSAVNSKRCVLKATAVPTIFLWTIVKHTNFYYIKISHFYGPA